eukprot:11540114-Karenia_brevis.AAC.1
MRAFLDAPPMAVQKPLYLKPNRSPEQANRNRILAAGVEQLLKLGLTIQELTFDRGTVYKVDLEGNAIKLGRVVD